MLFDAGNAASSFIEVGTNNALRSLNIMRMLFSLYEILQESVNQYNYVILRIKDFRITFQRYCINDTLVLLRNMGGEQFCIGFIEPKIMLIYEIYFALDSNLSNHFILNLLRNNRTDPDRQYCFQYHPPRISGIILNHEH